MLNEYSSILFFFFAECIPFMIGMAISSNHTSTKVKYYHPVDRSWEWHSILLIFNLFLLTIFVRSILSPFSIFTLWSYFSINFLTLSFSQHFLLSLSQSTFSLYFLSPLSIMLNFLFFILFVRFSFLLCCLTILFQVNSIQLDSILIHIEGNRTWKWTNHFFPWKICRQGMT